MFSFISAWKALSVLCSASQTKLVYPKEKHIYFEKLVCIGEYCYRKIPNFIVKAPDIIGGFFTLYESMISTVVNSGFLKILQYTFYMLLGAQIFLLNLSPFYFAVGLQWSPRVKNIPIMHHFQKQKYRYHLPLAFEAAHIFPPGLDIV